jgi:hypothetical protein
MTAFKPQAYIPGKSGMSRFHPVPTFMRSKEDPLWGKPCHQMAGARISVLAR